MPNAPGKGGGGKGNTGYTPPTSGPVTPREIYQLLLDNGASSIQAAGIMGNMLHESGLNPESGGIDSNGYWAGGLISWNTAGYTSARSLVTGNPQADVRAQIKYLFTNTNGLKPGLAGATAQDVGQNFAAHVEVCATCLSPTDPGANGSIARGLSAATIYTAAKTGNWGIITASSVPGTGGQSGSASNPPGSNISGGGGGSCVASWPSLGPIGGGCILSKSQARAFIGAGMLSVGGIIFGLGVVILVATAFSSTKAGRAVAGTAAKVAPIGRAASKLAG